MRTGTLLLAVLTLMVAAMLVMAGCTTTPAGNNTTTNATAGTPTVTPCAECQARANQTPTANMTGNVTSNGTAAAPPFTNTTWLWQTLEVGANRTVINDSVQYTVVFQPNGTYRLKADCNTGSGSYTVNGSALNLSPAAVTLAYCGEQSKDQLFLTSLMRVRSYEIDRNGNLLLNLADAGNRMVFSAPGAAAVNVSAPFVNATWRWVGKSGSETIQVPSPNQYTITFAQNGTYSIKADCNVGSGNYTVNGTKVKINPGPLTRAYCGDRSLDQKYLGSLYRVTSYIMDASGNLVLIMVSPNERLIFERVRLAGVRG